MNQSNSISSTSSNSTTFFCFDDLSISSNMSTDASTLTELKDLYSHCKENFNIVRCIGGGGFGYVYECQNKLDECHYALKRINLTQSDERTTLREVKALANFDHPHIVRYYCAWMECPASDRLEEYERDWQRYSEDSQLLDSSMSQDSQESDQPVTTKFLYIQMELCLDDTLHDWIAYRNSTAKGPLRHRQAKTYMSQLAAAVEYIHQNKWMHRDLKPDNIFFSIKSLQSHVKVGDFGLANISPHANEPFSLTPDVGTVVYMSPELQSNSAYNNKIDIYSLGVVFIELMCIIQTQQELVDILNSKNIRPDEYWNSQYILLCSDMVSTSPMNRPAAGDVVNLINSFIREEAEPVERKTFKI